jgi:hypothetical protein
MVSSIAATYRPAILAQAWLGAHTWHERRSVRWLPAFKLKDPHASPGNRRCKRRLFALASPQKR